MRCSSCPSAHHTCRARKARPAAGTATVCSLGNQHCGALARTSSTKWPCCPVERNTTHSTRTANHTTRIVCTPPTLTTRNPRTSSNPSRATDPHRAHYDCGNYYGNGCRNFIHRAHAHTHMQHYLCRRHWHLCLKWRRSTTLCRWPPHAARGSPCWRAKRELCRGAPEGLSSQHAMGTHALTIRRGRTCRRACGVTTSHARSCVATTHARRRLPQPFAASCGILR